MISATCEPEEMEAFSAGLATLYSNPQEIEEEVITISIGCFIFSGVAMIVCCFVLIINNYITRLSLTEHLPILKHPCIVLVYLYVWYAQTEYRRFPKMGLPSNHPKLYKSLTLGSPVLRNLIIGNVQHV